MQIKHERKKRYGWLLIFALINWGAVLAMIWWVDPNTIKNFGFERSYLPMMLLLGSGFFFVFSIILLSAKKELLWSTGVVVYLYLKIWGMGGWLNALLIFGLLGSWEWYWWLGKKHAEEIKTKRESEMV